MNQLVTGFKYAYTGFNLIFKPGIRLFVVVPLLINVALFTGAIVYGASVLNDFINSALTGWLEWLQWLLWPLFVIISLTVVFFCFTIIANLIGAPFNGFLAEKVELYLTGQTAMNQGGLGRVPAEIKNAIMSETRKFLYFLVIATPLIILFFIPMLNLMAPFLWFIFGAWMLALEYMDYPMGNHQMLFQQIRKYLRQHKPLAFGFGLGVMLLTLIPVVNFIAMPVAVCSATKMWVEKLQQGNTG